MKIAFFTVLFLEHGGGLEKYHIETAARLASKSGMVVDAVSMDNKFTLKIFQLLQIFYMIKINRSIIFKEKTKDIKKKLSKANYYKVSSITDLRKKLSGYDIIYSKNEILESFFLRFLIGYKNLPPVIFGCHTPVYYPLATSFYSKLHNFLYGSFVYKFLTTGVKVFHVTNMFDEKYLRKLLPNKDVIKIYNPSHIKELSLLHKKYKYNFSWDKRKINLLWTGRLTEQKGIPELLSIIDSINLKCEDKVVFNIVGDGVPEIKEKILAKKNKWGNINYFGYIPYNYIPNIIINNNLYISTSRWEGFGLSILEAQALGLPAIAFNIPGPQDIIEENKTGFLAQDEKDYVRKLTKLLNYNTGITKKTIQKSINRRFNEERLYDQLEKMFYHTYQRYAVK